MARLIWQWMKEWGIINVQVSSHFHRKSLQYKLKSIRYTPKVNLIQTEVKCNTKHKGTQQSEIIIEFPRLELPGDTKRFCCG